jgi:hypothetical protein
MSKLTCVMRRSLEIRPEPDLLLRQQLENFRHAGNDGGPEAAQEDAEQRKRHRSDGIGDSTTARLCDGLTLFTTPVIYLYLDRFSSWVKNWARSAPHDDLRDEDVQPRREAAE